MVDKCRALWHGDSSDLANVMLKFAKDVSFVDYPDESTKVAHSKLNIASAVAHGPLLAELRKLQKNFAFPRTSVEEALCIVYTSKDWELTKEEKKDWISCISRRFRNLCRCVGQADAREPLAKWIMRMPWRDAPDGGHDDEQHEDTWEYGYDDEVGLAWRMKPGTKKKHVSLALQCDETEPESAPVIARWPDGHEHSVPGLSMGKLRGARVIGGDKRSAGILWSMQAKDTKHTIAIIQKVDRHLLLALTEQARQILQLRMSDFGPVPDESRQLPRGNDTLASAVHFLTQIGKDYASGIVEKQNLKSLRDDLLLSLGWRKAPPRETGRPTKRPACAVDDDDAPSTKKVKPETVMKRPAMDTTFVDKDDEQKRIVGKQLGQEKDKHEFKKDMVEKETIDITDKESEEKDCEESEEERIDEPAEEYSDDQHEADDKYVDVLAFNDPPLLDSVQTCLATCNVE